MLQQLLGPPIREALAQESVVDEDLMLMIVMVPEPAQPCGLDVRVLAYPSGLAGSNSAGEAVILGGPRKIPVGKVGGGWAGGQAVQHLPLQAASPLVHAMVLMVVLPCMCLLRSPMFHPLLSLAALPAGLWLGG